MSIVIYCTDPDDDGQPTHEHVLVADLARVDEESAGRWRPAAEFPGMESVVQWLSGDEFVPVKTHRGAQFGALPPEPDRVRYKFRCRACGLKLVRRAEPVDMALDLVEKSGESFISLKGLARIVDTAVR